MTLPTQALCAPDSDYAVKVVWVSHNEHICEIYGLISVQRSGLAAVFSLYNLAMPTETRL